MATREYDYWEEQHQLAEMLWDKEPVEVFGTPDDYPPLAALEEKLELVDGVLHWRDPQANGDKHLLTTEGPRIFFNNKRYSTAVITWIMAYGVPPAFLVRPRVTSTGACNVVSNLVEVIPFSPKRSKPYIQYTLLDGFLLTKVVPSPFWPSHKREVAQRFFKDANEAHAWASLILSGMGEESLLDPQTPQPLPAARPRMHKGAGKFLSLPRPAPSTGTLPDLRDLALTVRNTAELPKFDPIKLDMLSVRACERFVGEALNFFQLLWPATPRTTGPSRTPSQTLTVALGAIDGAWRMSGTIQTQDGPRTHSRASQEACLVPYSVEVTIPLGRTPGRSPRELRVALLERYRKNPPDQASRKAALALLTPDRIAPLRQDLRKTQVDISLSPDAKTCDIPMPLFLLRLLHGVNPAEYRASRSAQRNQPGLLITVTRTRAGFIFRLAGWPKRTEQEQESPTKLARLLYPSRTSQARYDTIRKKTVYIGAIAGPDGIMRLAPLISEAITNRLNTEASTPKQLQTRGIKGSLFVFLGGQKLKLKEALQLHGNVVPYSVARARLARHWEVKEAVTKPVKTLRQRQPSP